MPKSASYSSAASQPQQQRRRLSRAGAHNSCTFDFALVSSNVGVVISHTHTHTHCILAPRFIHAFFSTFARFSHSLSDGSLRNLSFPCSHQLTHTYTHTCAVHPYVGNYERALHRNTHTYTQWESSAALTLSLVCFTVCKKARTSFCELLCAI